MPVLVNMESICRLECIDALKVDFSNQDVRRDRGEKSLKVKLSQMGMRG